MNPCPHATFQKPHLIFMMKINTILLTAQNLISVFYKSKTTPPLPLGRAMKGWGQGVRHARYSLINKPDSDRTGGWHWAATKPLWTPFCGLLYYNQNVQVSNTRATTAPSGSGSFTSCLARGGNLGQWISDASRLCLDLLLPVTSHVLHIEALII